MSLTIVLVLLSLAGSAIGQQFCLPDPYVADTFDVINFRWLRSYVDASQLLALYETEDDEYMYLIDLNTGTFYIDNQDGTCDKYEHPDAKLTVDELINSQQAFQLTTNSDLLTGYMFALGYFGMNEVFTDNCQNVFTSFSFNNELQLAFYNSGFRSFTYEDPMKLQEALENFQSANCQLGQL